MKATSIMGKLAKAVKSHQNTQKKLDTVSEEIITVFPRGGKIELDAYKGGTVAISCGCTAIELSIEELEEFSIALNKVFK